MKKALITSTVALIICVIRCFSMLSNVSSLTPQISNPGMSSLILAYSWFTVNDMRGILSVFPKKFLLSLNQSFFILKIRNKTTQNRPNLTKNSTKKHFFPFKN